MPAPEDVDVWIGLDVGKDTHFADVLDDAGDRLHARAVGNDEADLDALLDSASTFGTPGLVIDQPGSIAQLAIAVGELDRLHRRRDALAGEIEEVFLAHPFGEILVTLPGIGPRTGARILAEIGDGSRFSSGAKLASYAGLAPVDRQSGAQRRVAEPPRQPSTQKRDVPRGVRVAAVAGLQSLLRPQTRRRQTPQRRADLPSPPPLQRHPRHAPHPPALPAPTHPTDDSSDLEKAA